MRKLAVKGLGIWRLPPRSSVSWSETSAGPESAAAAVVVGMVAGIAAQRWRTLALVFVVPGLLPLLPGLVLYRGSLLLTTGDTVEGLVVLLEAAVRMLALAAGALLGELLVRRRRPG